MNPIQTPDNEVARLREEKEYWANQWNVLRQSSVADVVKAQEEIARLRDLCEEAIESLGDQYFCHITDTWKANKTKLKLREKLTQLTK